MNMNEKTCRSMLVAGGVALIASCGASDGFIGGENCSAVGLPGAIIFVVDPAGARISSPDMTYSFQGGSFLKADCGTDGQCYVGNAPGTYTLRTSKPGYVSREDIVQAPATCLLSEFTIVLTRV
jgi:hypothetical protein